MEQGEKGRSRITLVAASTPSHERLGREGEPKVVDDFLEAISRIGGRHIVAQSTSRLAQQLAVAG